MRDLFIIGLVVGAILVAALWLRNSGSDDPGSSLALQGLLETPSPGADATQDIDATIQAAIQPALAVNGTATTITAEATPTNERLTSPLVRDLSKPNVPLDADIGDIEYDTICRAPSQNATIVIWPPLLSNLIDTQPNILMSSACPVKLFARLSCCGLGQI